MTIQDYYDKGIYTGWALVIEMIERGDVADIPALSSMLQQRIQDKMDPRLQLVIDHMSAMYQTLTLPKNAAKGDWYEEKPYEQLQEARKEMEELHAALWDWYHHNGSIDRVRSEAADVSNRVAMIADNCRLGIR